jgi:ring-1,2-phenylacetyl-CoA epoxidase subunit PaaD
MIMANRKATNRRQIETLWQALQDVKDPEIPVISVIDMGIVREIALEGERVKVTMTPTFSGCPALHVMKEDIARRVKQLGYEDICVEISLYPPWRTDWITNEGRAKLKDFGLAPPPLQDGRSEIIFFDFAACPYCDSENTTLKNNFGPTLCRSIYFCESCQQPFEQFKAL